LPNLSIGVRSDEHILLHSLANCALESEIENWILERVRRRRKQP
jgi:hypothetical protein